MICIVDPDSVTDDAILGLSRFHALGIIAFGRVNVPLLLALIRAPVQHQFRRFHTIIVTILYCQRLDKKPVFPE